MTTSKPLPDELSYSTISDGLEVACGNLGASIVSLRVPIDGNLRDVVLGYPKLGDYLDDPYYMGSTVGRYAGRISGGHFTLEGKRHAIAKYSNQSHALHGGIRGFHQYCWEQRSTSNSNSLSYHLESCDGDQGFPGTLRVNVRYRIVNQTQLVIDTFAETDKTTVINLVNHAYFNLNQQHEHTINNHQISVYADRITPLDDELVPTGEIVNVGNTEFDLRPSRKEQSHRIGERVFDQNYALNKPLNKLGLAATISVPNSNLAMAVYTTQPGLQFYTGDYLQNCFLPRAGLCLEAQNFPDSPNHANFPSTVIRPNQRFHAQTIYAFGTLEELLELDPSSQQPTANSQ